jgi:hypothetical protein
MHVLKEMSVGNVYLRPENVKYLSVLSKMGTETEFTKGVLVFHYVIV